MRTVAVHNLGCKVNSYELDIMVQQLREQGYEFVPFDGPADVYIINTCTVTNIADRKSRQMIHKARGQNKDAVVVAVGCYVETDAEQVAGDNAIDLAIGNNKKGEIAGILERYLDARAAAGKTPAAPQGDAGTAVNGVDADTQDGQDHRGMAAVPDKTLGGATLADLTHTPEVEHTHLTVPGRTRADIKIQDGCNQFCTYCIIPYARGRIRSRDPEEIVTEVQGLAAAGTTEVVLTGIHISSYGRDRGENPEEALLALLTRVNMIAGIRRIRLGSLEPMIMTEAFVKGIAGLSRVCPHFHLSLQSGCDATLKRMNRHYTAAQFYEGVERLRRYYDRPALTTDVIVGFPGETAEDFEASRAFCEQVEFYEMHVFKYSIRHGTPAATMPNQLTNAQKGERSDVLLAMTARQARAYRESFIGEDVRVLLETARELDGQLVYTGHTERYVECAIPAADLESALGARESYAGCLVEGMAAGVSPSGEYLLLEGARGIR